MLKERIRIVVWAMAAVGGMSVVGRTAAESPKAPVPPAVIAAAEPVAVARPAVQLADEITRRLRRIGINVIKTRLDRPYDPEGELC